MPEIEQTITVQSGYILIQRPPGFVVQRDQVLQEMLELADLCDQESCHKVLILGAQTTVVLSTTDIFDLGKQISASGIRMAVVETHDAPDTDVQFFEDVTANRCGPVRFFDCREDAMRWLDVQ